MRMTKMQSCQLTADPPAPIRIALVGMPASGKTEATYILRETLGVESIQLGQVVREEVRSRGLEDTYENLELVAQDLRLQFGQDIVIRRTAHLLMQMNYSICCIDGVRSLSEIAALKQYFPNLITVAIHASPSLRFKRTKRVPPPMTQEEFEWRDRQNLTLGLGGVIALADFVVVHEDSSRAKFGKSLSHVLTRIMNRVNYHRRSVRSRHPE